MWPPWCIYICIHGSVRVYIPAGRCIISLYGTSRGAITRRQCERFLSAKCFVWYCALQKHTTSNDGKEKGGGGGGRPHWQLCDDDTLLSSNRSAIPNNAVPLLLHTHLDMYLALSRYRPNILLTRTILQSANANVKRSQNAYTYHHSNAICAQNPHTNIDRKI